MKKYNIVLTQKRAAILKQWLKDNNINYEPSSYGDNIYFNIIATEEQAQAINDKLDTLF